jgi:hypothetical protein
MLYWYVLGMAVFVGLIIWYWYNPSVFKVHPEKKYPENYAKHPDPHYYKKNYR